jgi:hypothetical protein
LARRTVLACLLAILPAIGIVPRGVARAGSVLPAQFVAKSYTEVLGRAPDQAEWRRAVDVFESEGCSPESLRDWQSRLLLGDEYAHLGYDADARILTLHRAALNREPDEESVERWRGEMSRRTPWRSVVERLYASAEFTRLARDVICDPDAPHAPNYLFGTDPPIDLGAKGPGIRTESELRDALRPNGVPAAPGTTVLLAQQATISVSATLVVPPGVSVATAGSPRREGYARMARLVRDRPDDQYGAVVALDPGAVLTHVWVDGQGDDPYAVPRANQGRAVDVLLNPGAVGARVLESRVDNASSGGFTTILAEAGTSGPGCGAAQRALISGNLVTAYSSVHADGWWRDGISVACEHTDVTGNAVVDASDAAIIVYRPLIGAQTSTVRDNLVLNAGNSAFAGLAADPLAAPLPTPDTDCDSVDFSGTAVRDNLLWTGDRTQFDFGLSVGTRGFSFLGPSWCTGRGAAFVGNTTGVLPARFVEAVAVSGMLDATTAGNFAGEGIVLVHPSGVDRGCPERPSVAEVRAGHASGHLQAYDDHRIQGCLGRPRRAGDRADVRQ